MKKLLATTAVLVAFAGAASAQQSVLERVLAQVDNSTNLASVNGTFANIAENIGGLTATDTYAGGAATSSTGTTLGASSSTAVYEAWVARNTVAQTYNSVAGDQVYYNAATGQVIRTSTYSTLTAGEQAGFTAVAAASSLIANNDGTFSTIVTSGLAAELAARDVDLVRESTDYTTTYIGGIEGINGSINNVINGLDTATMVAAVGAVTATEFLLPTVDLGNISSTVLGAVNTGEITLGVNQAVDQAKTTSTGALSSVIEQIGGSADTGALVLNIASNMTGVNGSINNTMTGVNGSVGTAATTVLGAVNTGTITSGINAAVAGIVGGTSQSGL